MFCTCWMVKTYILTAKIWHCKDLRFDCEGGLQRATVWGSLWSDGRKAVWTLIYSINACVYLSYIIGGYGLPWWLSGKEPDCQCRRPKRHSLIPVLERSLREGNGNPLWYSCLENSMDKGAWWATVHGVTQSQTRLSAHARTHLTHIWRYIKYTVYLWIMWELGLQPSTQSKIHVEFIVGPLYLWCLSIQGSSSVASTASGRVVLYLLLKKQSTCKWTYVIQTHVVQRSTVYR